MSSNMFKSSNRFDSLFAEDKKHKKEEKKVEKKESDNKFNSFKDSGSGNTDNYRRDRDRREYRRNERDNNIKLDDRFNKQFEETKKKMEIMEKEENERKKVEGLKVSEFSFPELVVDVSINVKKEEPSVKKQQVKMNYIEASKKEVIYENNNKNEITPGWSKIYKDTNNKIIIRDSLKVVNMKKKYSEEYSIKKNINKGMQLLVNRWEKYKRDYIDTYGYDVYEKTYLNKDEYDTNRYGGQTEYDYDYDDMSSDYNEDCESQYSDDY